VIEVLPVDAFWEGNLAREGTYVVAFVADWCPFCREFLPEFSALDGGSAYRTAIADLSSAKNPLWDEMGIEVVPTLIVFRAGRALLRVDGIPGEGIPPHGLEQAEAVARGSPPDTPPRVSPFRSGQRP